jgi:sodium-dependent dicarboxylate transporter 2/3/5
LNPKARRRLSELGLWAGPLLAVAAGVALPEGYVSATGEQVALDTSAHVTAALAVWMAIWWLSEAIPVYATALLPLVVLPLSGVATVRETASPYAHELIFLFLGGFLLALAMERWELHRRVALRVLRLAGDAPRRVIGGFMGVTAGLSMWVSNSATAIVMLPVAVSVIELVGSQVEDETTRRRFALALLLGVAYSASIGGVATPIGTPPNLLLLSYAKSELGVEISFARWTATLLPLVLPFLFLAWLLLTRVLFPIRLHHIEGCADLVRRRLHELGPMERPEWIVACSFLAAALLWITRPLLGGLQIGGVRPLSGLTDTGIAMIASLVLFAAPTGRADARFVLDWDTASRLPWGVLLLFGGGLSLAAAIGDHGVGAWLGASLAGLHGVSPLWIVLAAVTLTVFLTELTSNTASTRGELRLHAPGGDAAERRRVRLGPAHDP